MRPNIIFYFSDQQRWDTLNSTLMPNVWELGENGVLFSDSYTCQPVCGPARACLQTGQFATENRCYWNGIALKENTKTLADYFNENGYDTAYIGKWHLASDRYPGVGVHCEKTAVPRERQGGYKYWRAADILEFTSHGYDGYVFDENGKKIDFTGYRADCINDFAVEYINNHNREKPFFMFVSQLEPHHQNDRGHFEGPTNMIDKFRNYPLPEDLVFLNGNYKDEYPDYLAAIHSLDENMGKLVKTLKDKGIYDNTVIVYTSDHGCHFKTRNAEYKRSCHDSSIHTPLVFGGGAVNKSDILDCLVSLIDIPPTLLSLADIPIPETYSGNILPVNKKDVPERDCVFIQISESQVGRAVRTKEWKYSARAIGSGWHKPNAVHYFDDFLYDLKNDPYEKNNLVNNKNCEKILSQMRALLSREMVNAGEKKPIFHKPLKTRKY
ncbi:MAG: sulfatase-like hydrolase/transferase [Clostridia bacterium]|nr:sulfatase-like hydrolase/transferase [Clostridia bacterium]